MARIVYNTKAFEAMRRSPGVKADLRRRADAIAAACGDGFVAASGEGKTRSRAAVIAASGRARRVNARDNTMLRNLDAGR